jgi:hypothetical protein
MGQLAKVIWLRKEAPRKPALGAPCNGCGVCCAAGPCPVALAFLHQRRGSCKALQWDEAGQAYRCGMVRDPGYYLHWLPAWSISIVQRLVLRWIAAGTACDAADETEES